MAQTGFTPIVLYHSSTGSAVPLAADLTAGELAINTSDEKLYFKNAAGTVKVLANAAIAGITPGTGVATALAVNIGSAGAPVVNGGALGTPSSGNFSTGTFTWPTFNQNTSGTAAGLSATLAASSGGTGVANNAASTITISGNFASTFVVGGAYSYTFPNATDTLVNLGSAQTLTSKTLTNPTVTNYTESTVAIGTVTTASTISLTSGTVQTATLTASTACTFTMPTPTAGKSFILLLKQAATTGNGTATFTSVKWGTAGAPTITATAGKMDILSFVSDGTSWYGSAAQGYTP